MELKQIRECSRLLGIPQQLVTQADVYVLYDAGPAHNEVKVVARCDVDRQHLADQLKHAVAGTAFAKNPIVTRYLGRGFQMAQARFSKSRLFLMSSSATAPVGRVVAGLRKAGLEPHTVLMIPGYADATALSLPHRQHYYDASNAPADLTVTVRTDLSVVGALLNVAIAIYVPAVYLLSIPPMRRFGNERSIPKRLRAKAYRRRSNCIVFGAVAGYFALGLVNVWIGAFGRTVDLWIPFSIFGVTMFVCGSPFVLLALYGVLNTWQPESEPSYEEIRKAAEDARKRARRDPWIASSLQLVVATASFAFGNAMASVGVWQWAWILRAIGVLQTVLAVVRIARLYRK